MGSMPALASVTNLYTGPISLSGSRNFLFIARKVNYLDSAPVTNAYTAQLPPPSFVTPSATFSGPTPITVQSADNYGGTFVLTSPSGAVQTVNTTNNTASFTINEGGQFTLLLQRNGWTPSLTGHAELQLRLHGPLDWARLDLPLRADDHQHQLGWHEPEDPNGVLHARRERAHDQLDALHRRVHAH